MAMSVPGQSSAYSPAGQALGFGGGSNPLQEDETEEQKRLRLQQMQQRRAMGPASQLLGLGAA
jgi:hypothetical protein